eukprot:UN32766
MSEISGEEKSKLMNIYHKFSKRNKNKKEPEITKVVEDITNSVVSRRRPDCMPQLLKNPDNRDSESVAANSGAYNSGVYGYVPRETFTQGFDADNNMSVAKLPMDDFFGSTKTKTKREEMLRKARETYRNSFCKNFTGDIFTHCIYLYHFSKLMKTYGKDNEEDEKVRSRDWKFYEWEMKSEYSDSSLEKTLRNMASNSFYEITYKCLDDMNVMLIIFHIHTPHSRQKFKEIKTPLYTGTFQQWKQQKKNNHNNNQKHFNLPDVKNTNLVRVEKTFYPDNQDILGVSYMNGEPTDIFVRFPNDDYLKIVPNNLTLNTNENIIYYNGKSQVLEIMAAEEDQRLTLDIKSGLITVCNAQSKPIIQTNDKTSTESLIVEEVSRTFDTSKGTVSVNYDNGTKKEYRPFPDNVKEEDKSDFYDLETKATGIQLVKMYYV